MPEIKWDQVGERTYETGVDHGVLYRRTGAAYDKAYPWNGLTTVTESPSGAEATAVYADNIKYLNLVSAEDFGGTIEAVTYPDEFAYCDGTAEVAVGVSVGQQNREIFGFAYRTKVGNDIVGQDFGYKLHLVYGALAAPSEKAHSTVNDSPEALAFSWEFSTTPVEVPGLKPSATLTIDSTKVDADALASLEDILYGRGTGAGATAHLPLPEDVIALFAPAEGAAAMTVQSLGADGTSNVQSFDITGTDDGSSFDATPVSADPKV
jgi:hypothetical protein